MKEALKLKPDINDVLWVFLFFVFQKSQNTILKSVSITLCLNDKTLHWVSQGSTCKQSNIRY